MRKSELEYHQELYAGEAQELFAKPAVRRFRAHLVRRILRQTVAGAHSRVLSLGCGIGDTELLLAPHVKAVVGLDIAPNAIRQATSDAQQLGLANATFLEGSVSQVAGQSFDVVLGIFFLHHLLDADFRETPLQIFRLLQPGGVFYGLDPSRNRLSGKIGAILTPHLLEKYQSPQERQLEPSSTAAAFRAAGFDAIDSMYDFTSTPAAGLFPRWQTGYRIARQLDELLIRMPLLRHWGSNFEIVARKR